MSFSRVSAQINSQTFQPRPHHPQNGSLHIDVDMSPMASPNHDNRLLGRRGLELTSFLEALYRDSECIDFESLCIKEGELAVELKIMVRILDDEGSLFDCASIAITTALSLYRRPFVEIRDGLAITVSGVENMNNEAERLVELNFLRIKIKVLIFDVMKPFYLLSLINKTDIINA
jgi:exosome complex RNA-binding protein Rrp42 (RNase PH superfamily)